MSDYEETYDMYYYKGWRWVMEGFYIWLGERLPDYLVYRATSRLIDYAEENDLETYDIVEAQSLWLKDKLR